MKVNRVNGSPRCVTAGLISSVLLRGTQKLGEPGLPYKSVWNVGVRGYEDMKYQGLQQQRF